jgi:mannose/fructose/N-acetylgalactosamine-specific phosphotransferase system component IIB
MTPAIFRVDNRLVHGQVFTWINRLHLTEIVVANDRVEADLIQRSLIDLAVQTVFQGGLKIQFVKIEETLTKLEDPKLAKEKILLLVDSLADGLTLIERGLSVSEINIGGLYNQEGRNKTQYSPSLFLNDDDIRIIEELIRHNVTVSPEALPGDGRADILKLIRKIP